MNTVFALLVVFNAGLLAVIFAAARADAFRQFSSSALNPYVIFGLISILINIDFVTVYLTPTSIEFLETKSFMEPAATLDAYCVATLIAASGTLGLAVAAALPAKVNPSRPSEPDAASLLAASVIGMFGLLTAVATWSAWPSGRDDFLSGQVLSRENPLLATITWVQPMALALYLAHIRNPFSFSGVVVALLTTLALAGVGVVRVVPLTCLLVAAVALATRRKISALWYLPLTPAIAVYLAYTRLIFRETEYSDFNELVRANGGLWNMFFGDQEISFAKMFAAVYAFAPELPAIGPFHGVFSAIVAPFPRALIAWKPYGASAVFTEYTSPLRWEQTKSETLVSGYGELYWELGAVGACFAMGLLAFVWGRLCIRTVNNRPGVAIIWLPILIWAAYSFLRGDLFNTALVVWPAALVRLSHRGLAGLFNQLISIIRPSLAVEHVNGSERD